MENPLLSVIIPARNEIYLEKTLRSVLDAARGDIEIIAVLDGYLPDPPIEMNDNRVTFIHYAESIGQRAAINEAVKVSNGKYIMKLDAHCVVDEGFDVKLAADCEPDWTVVPRMYNLDVTTWQPKLHKRTDYMYFTSMASSKPFRAMYYGRGGNKLNDTMIDDTMCCMGPCWFMHKDRFISQGGCDEQHGGWGQQGIEVALKAWLSGGALKVNKNTWFAHWFRGGGVPEGHKAGFPYSLKEKTVEKARQHSQDLWLNDKWPPAKRKLNWVIDKFNPPGWRTATFDKKAYYNATINRPNRHNLTNKAHWMGVPVIKYPGDMMLYQEIIFKNKPDILVETGSDWGGSALFFAHVFDAIGHGQVVTIDKRVKDRPQHPRITYVTGKSTDSEVMATVRKMTEGKATMVSLDSCHVRRHVKRELMRYGPLVTKGQYMVVEDTNYPEVGGVDGPDEAVQWYLRRTKDFVADPLEQKWIFSTNPGGWLRKK